MNLILAQEKTVTDWALPIAKSINKFLWNWSPWHLKYTRLLPMQETRISVLENPVNIIEYYASISEHELQRMNNVEVTKLIEYTDEEALYAISKKLKPYITVIQDKDYIKFNTVRKYRIGVSNVGAGYF